MAGCIGPVHPTQLPHVPGRNLILLMCVLQQRLPHGEHVFEVCSWMQNCEVLDLVFSV